MGSKEWDSDRGKGKGRSYVRRQPLAATKQTGLKVNYKLVINSTNEIYPKILVLLSGFFFFFFKDLRTLKSNGSAGLF